MLSANPDHLRFGAEVAGPLGSFSGMIAPSIPILFQAMPNFTKDLR
jgi:hypothetical protein